MTPDATMVDGLARLDGRAWAQLLRAVRAAGGRTDALDAALARPSGELASGSPRRELCVAIAASEVLLDELRSDAALPAAVHAVIAAAEVQDAVVPDDAAADRRSRSEERARELRRSLDDERRRREGAEARATAAEARAEEAAVERDALRAQVDALAAELAAARDTVEQAAARAERRSGSRVGALERELSEERRALESLRREHERSRAEVAALREEVEVLRSRTERPTNTATAAGGGRPLVLPEGLDPATTEAARWLAERATTLIVDGYNATLTLRPDRSLEQQRRWLVDRLRPLAARAAIRPVVIFDGEGGTGRMRDTGGVEVRFSASGIIADDEIVFAVAATDDPVLVVTDDAELRARVRSEGGNVIGVVHLLGVVDA